jgi:hypothetical protein
VHDLLDALAEVQFLTQSTAPGLDYLIEAGCRILTWNDPDRFTSLHHLLSTAVRSTAVWASLFLLIPSPQRGMLDDHFFPMLFTLEECGLPPGSIFPFCLPGGGLDGVACHHLALLQSTQGRASLEGGFEGGVVLGCE